MRAIALLALAAALVSASTASAEPPATCSLLTRVEVANAIGTRSVTAARRAAGHSNASCTWTGPGTGTVSEGRPTVRIDITPVSRSAFLRMSRLTSDAVTVRGVGELAYRQRSELAVYDHGYWIEIATVLVGSPAAAQRHLATLVVKRLTA